MTSTLVIETPRLVLRTVTMEDLDVVAESWQLDEGPISREEAEERVTAMLRSHQEIAVGKFRHLCLAIVDQESGAFIGWCGLDHRDRRKAHPVLFYLLKRGFWGEGLATEAAEALLRYAFGELGLSRVDGGAALENVASRRVMEKIGMTYLGLNAEGGHAFTLGREEYSGDRSRPNGDHQPSHGGA